MKVLFTSFDALGHVNVMLPLAEAIRDRGHELRWATGAMGCAALEKAGIAAVRAGMDNPGQRREYEARHAAEISALGSHEERRAHIFPRMFGAIGTPPMLADLRAIVGTWKPDLLIHEAGELAGPIAATAAGIPHVTHAFGSLVPRPIVEEATQMVSHLWREAGIEARPYAGCYDHLYIDIYPPMLQPWDMSHVGDRQLLRPIEVAADATRPRQPGKPPVVYLTFGTVVNRSAPFQAAVQAMRPLNARVLVTVGSTGDPQAFGELPAHISVERFIPQAEILPQCDLVVSHGGSGTVLGGLAHGIPQLCLPQMADQFVNAAAVTACGAGLQLRPEEADPASLGAALQRLLTQPSFRAAAAGVAAEIAAMPSAAEVAAILEARFS